MEEAASKEVRDARRKAREAYESPILKEKLKLKSFTPLLVKETHNDTKLQLILSRL